MQKYWLVFRLSIQDILEYRFDFFLHAFKYAMMVILMSLVWTAVSRESATLEIETRDTVQYFFLAAMVYTLSNFHPFYIEDDIRLGTLSKYLLKPIKPFGYYFTYEAAITFFETSLKLVIIPLLLFGLGYSLTFDLSRIGVLLLYLPLIFVYAYHQFGLVSGLTFWISETWSIRWSLTILFRFLSGILVPIYLFPDWAQAISFYLPFEHLAYRPIQMMLGKVSLGEAFQSLAILGGWTVVVMVLRGWQWSHGYLKYESTGA